MSEASKRGRDFEVYIAKLIRQKLKTAAARDKRSGAGDFFKADIRIPGQDFFIEAKSQEKTRIAEWFKDACDKSGYKTPLLVVDQGGHYDMAVLRLADLLDLVKTIIDDTETIKELRG